MRLSGRRATTCLSDFALDAWASGELEPAASAQLESHLAECAGCGARHAALEEARAAFLALAPAFEVHAQRFVRPRSQRPRRMRAGILGAVALAAVALLALRPHRMHTRLKGSESLRCFVKRGEHVAAVSGATVLRPGDRLRFVYSSEQARYFALTGHDARGASVYYPDAAEVVPLRAGNQIALDFSLELDDAPGPEVLTAWFCPERFELAPLRAALAAGEHPEPPRACHVETLSLRKDLAP